jgi:hypothetical protein
MVMSPAREAAFIRLRRHVHSARVRFAAALCGEEESKDEGGRTKRKKRMKAEGGRMNFRSSQQARFFILHPSAFILGSIIPSPYSPSTPARPMNVAGAADPKKIPSIVILPSFAARHARSA